MGLFVVYGWDHSDCGMQPVLVVLMRVIGSSGDVMRLPRRVGGGGCRRFFGDRSGLWRRNDGKIHKQVLLWYTATEGWHHTQLQKIRCPADVDSRTRDVAPSLILAGPCPQPKPIRAQWWQL